MKTKRDVDHPYRVQGVDRHGQPIDHYLSEEEMQKLLDYIMKPLPTASATYRTRWRNKAIQVVCWSILALIVLSCMALASTIILMLLK